MKVYDLSTVELERLSILFYGEYGAGKTYMLRDIIESERALGTPAERILYVSLAGDEGYMPLRGLDVPAVELDDPKDIDALIKKFTPNPLEFMLVDGLDKLSELSMLGTLGGADRAPRTGSAKDNEWGMVHRDYFKGLARLRKCASFFVATAPADRYVNPVTGDARIYPDLPGSQASRVIGAFDFTLGIEVKTSPRGAVNRILRVKPTGEGGGQALAFKLRQRLVHELREDIDIADGGGTWSVLKQQIQEAMQA